MANKSMIQPERLNLEGFKIFPGLTPILNELLVLPPEIVMIRGPFLLGKRGTNASDAVISWANLILQEMKNCSETGIVKNHCNFTLSDGRVLKLIAHDENNIEWEFNIPKESLNEN